MTGVVAVFVFALFAMVVMRPGRVVTGENVLISRIEYRSFWLGLAFFAIVFSLFKGPHAFGLVAGLLVHELGHFLAYRALGHDGARFRALPMVASLSTSDKATRSDAEEAFIALAGAGLSLVPMVPLVGIGLLLDAESSALHPVLMSIGGTIAALNALNLLPLWPLDGGRCLALIGRSLMPRKTVLLLLATSAFATALGFHVQSTTLLMTCLVGAHFLYHPEALAPKHAAMPKKTAGLVFLTWAALMGAHMAGGWWLLNWFFFSGL